MLNKILLFILSLIISLCLKATEVYICHWTDESSYSCDLINDKPAVSKEESEETFDFSTYIDDSTNTQVVGN